MKKTALQIIIAACLVLFFLSGHSQENREIEVTAQGILARVDKILGYPNGLIKGRMKHIFPDGKSFVIELEGLISKDDFLFKFSSKDRGEQIKVLYNMKGEDIWVYNNHQLKLYHKIGIDKYDPLLSTNFFYVDMSKADLQSNYTATIEGETFLKGYDAFILKLKPIYKGGEYGYLTLFVTKDKFIPLRIDYHDRDNAIFKFMNVVKVQEKEERIVPIRYDMMNIRTGTVTILSFFSFEEDMKFSKEIFRSEKLGE